MFKLFTIILFIFFNIPYSKEDIIIRPIRIFDNNNKNAQQDSEPAVVSKRTYQVQGPGGPITVTQIHISKSKNLGGDLNRPTPISMLSDIDSFFNSEFLISGFYFYGFLFRFSFILFTIPLNAIDNQSFDMFFNRACLLCVAANYFVIIPTTQRTLREDATRCIWNMSAKANCI